MLELIDRLVGIIRTNSLGFGKILGLCTGHALCPTFSLLSHDCMSNCRYAAKELDEQDEIERHDGPRHTALVKVRAMRHIEKGQELTVQYKGTLIGKVLTQTTTFARTLHINIFLLEIQSFSKAQKHFFHTSQLRTHIR